ncbi:zinc finger, CCHC-type containing protein [Tanacetum coccineum]
MTGNRKLFSTYKAYNGGNVIFGSNLRGNIISKGMISNDSLNIDNVEHVDNLGFNLLSVGQICDNKCRVTFSEHDSEITKDGKVIGRGIRKKGLYVMKLGNKPKDKICLATIDENSTLWHRRLGYANMRLIQSLASKELVRNLPKLKFDQHFCDACKIGKQAHVSHKAKNIVSTTRRLELLYMDLFGPSTVRSYGGNRYTLVIVDDYSREFDKEVQFGEFYNANGITHNFSALRTPQSNGVVDDDLDEEEAIRETEKKNQENAVEDETLEIDEIVNIKESRNHPLENVIGNLNQRTLRLQAQNQSNLFYFISTIEPKNVNEALGDESWIVAIQEELNQFIANDVWKLVSQPQNMTIIGTKWVFKNKLDENSVVSQNKAWLVAQGYNQQEGIDYDETYAPVARLESIRILLAYACALDFKLFQMDVKSSFLNGFINEEVYVAQPPGFIDFEKPDHVYKLKKDLYGLKQAPRLEILKKFGLEDSKPMKTPMSSDTKLMKEEDCESIDSTKYRGTTHLGLWYPKGTDIETIVYANSDHAGDYVDQKRTSARLVIQGFRQKEGIDYFDTYAPVARITAIRLLLALATIHNLVIHEMDVKTTFLNGDLDEEVYMKQLEGFVMPGNQHKVCKLVKSLYGLKQAPKKWHQKFDEVVLSSGFHLNQSDKCVYSKFNDSGKGVIICLYVDDMLIFGTDQNQVDKTKKFLSSRFSMKDMGEADVILGIKIKHENKGIVITQSHYNEKILKKFNCEDCSPVSTPMDPIEKLKPNTDKHMDQLEYSRAIGCLMYAMTSTRPDIAYVVGRLKAYSNASWINHVEDSSSTSGWVFLLRGGAISLDSKKQTCITGSTMESEFVVLAAAGKESEWLRNLIHKIPIWPKPIAPISIRCDSAPIMARAYSQIYNGKSRHLGVRHSMVRELIRNGVISIEFVQTQHNLADHLMKGLARDLVYKSVIRMGLKSI